VPDGDVAVGVGVIPSERLGLKLGVAVAVVDAVLIKLV